MTYSQTAFLQRSRRWLRLGLTALLALASTGLAAADNDPPRLPQVLAAPLMGAVPAAPTNVEAVLIDRMAVDAVSPARYSSQDFVVNQDDSQGADDFCIPEGDASWVISNVDVVGGYNNNSYTVSTVNVFFYANSGVLPGSLLQTRVVSGGNLANANTGSFALTLNPPVQLAGDNCYWVSVQAVQPGGFNAGETWQWVERTAATADGSPSVYRLPSKPQSGCQNWGARLATCFPGSNTNPDFTFRLSGSVSGSHLTPHIDRLNPSAGLNTDIELALVGFNFAAGATVSWTPGANPTQVFATTIINGSNLTAHVPAAYVGPDGATATVKVTNPGPCIDSCESNTLIFNLEHVEYVNLPIAWR